MNPAPRKQLPLQQLPLCCPCGETALYRRGLCVPCYNRRRRERARFAGQRDRVLARDRGLCRVCRAPAPPALEPALVADHPLPGVPRAPASAPRDRPLGA